MSYYIIEKPSAYPESAPPGPVLITIPVTSELDYYTEVIVQIRIFEGSFLPGSGRVLDVQSKSVGIYPSLRTGVQFMHSSELTSQSRRDIEVSIWQGNTKYAEDSWDDIFYVTSPSDTTQVLEVDITGGFGYVSTSPASLEGKTVWHNNDAGTFPYGTKVEVTAYPDAGYRFEKWSDEIEGGVSLSNPAYVKPMTEHRAVKCHFRVIEEEPVQRLEIDITPGEAGTVITNPASLEGRSTWANGNIGTFEHGTIVQVTAMPASGYQFEKWSDEIQGGVSYSNPASVKPMTEHRAVKCHFRVIEAPPVCNADNDCPPGYVCQAGECVPAPPPGEEEPPPGKMNWPLVGGIAGGVLLLVGLTQRKKK